MHSLRDFDPSSVFVDNIVSRKEIENRDILDTSKVVDKFAGYLFDDSGIPYHAIFAILSATGGGKTFFMAMLYHLIKEKYPPHNVYYIDSLQFAIHSDINAIFEKLQMICRSKTPIVLIDNLEKHSPRFIVDFIYRLNELMTNQKLACVLSYDDNVVQSKLYSLFGEGQDTYHLFQSYVDIEFFIGYSKGKAGNIVEVEISENNAILSYIVKVFLIFLFEKTSMTRVVILKKKMVFFIEKTELGSYEPKELFWVFYFMALKLIDREQYQKLLTGEKELSLEDEMLKNAIETVIDTLNYFDPDDDLKGKILDVEDKLMYLRKAELYHG